MTFAVIFTWPLLIAFCSIAIKIHSVIEDARVELKFSWGGWPLKIMKKEFFFSCQGFCCCSLASRVNLFLSSFLIWMLIFPCHLPSLFILIKHTTVSPENPKFCMFIAKLLFAMQGTKLRLYLWGSPWLVSFPLSGTYLVASYNKMTITLAFFTTRQA